MNDCWCRFVFEKNIVFLFIRNKQSLDEKVMIHTFFHWIVSNGAKEEISKWVFQENKARQVFWKTTNSYHLIRTIRITNKIYQTTNIIKCILYNFLILGIFFLSLHFSDLIRKIKLLKQEILKVQNIVTLFFSYLRNNSENNSESECNIKKTWTSTGIGRIEKNKSNKIKTS